MSSFTNITVSVCSSSTCIGKETPYRASGITVLYAFDGNTNDLSGYASGTPSGTNPPTGFLNQGYVRQTLNFNANLSQYVTIPSVNLTKQSFTIQVWIYPVGSNGQVNYGIFGICHSDLICLSLSLFNNIVAFSFDSMNVNNKMLIGATVIEIAAWSHITVVYDAVLFQQLIYVNGRIDAVSSGIVNPYQGKLSSSTSTIGLSSSYTYNTSYFYG
jgi:hypothetical protein